MVVPLAQCVARPDEGTARHFLIHHLERVANAAGAPDGSTNDRLAFLAGLLHDAAKCHVDWQEYIDPASSRKKGPPHSPMGAALFTFVAERLISIWHSDRQERLVARDRMLNWLMAINGHHGRLGDFHGISLPWMKIVSRYSVRNLAAGCDLAGIFELVKRFFPEFEATVGEFTYWLVSFDRSWVKLVDNGRRKVLEMNPPDEVAMRFPLDFSRLIIADRLDAGKLADDYLKQSAAVEAINSHSLYCNQQATQAIARGASHEMVELRRAIQYDALDKYRECPRGRFYTLLLPTGYGKTLTSLRIAIESAALSQSKRLIYVAPYLSILSQAANEISAATRIAVFQHHHLSLAAMASNTPDAADAEQTGFGIDGDDDFEVLDTWKVPILATTFNQFFRALFPSRAQQTLRIDAIKRAFVIIDEPQIIDIGVWNLFLRALRVFALDHDCQILFTTATLPPLRRGLEHEATPLAPSVKSQYRYDIQFIDEDLTRDTLTDRVLNDLESNASIAVVLNSVRDAAMVFQSIQQQLPRNTQLFCLTAMMLPTHKRRTIATIAKLLDVQREAAAHDRVVVVCTQILEAGVDLSFRRIFRARSIFPSIAQVAGRANRHNEGTAAKVFVFPFKADGELEVRRFVYRDKTACQITDQIFAQNSRICETEMQAQLDDYYDRCWQQNTQTARLKAFEIASLGAWSSLAGLEPFGFSPPREEIFVPLDTKEIDPQKSQEFIRRFAPEGAQQLLERKLDQVFQSSLSLQDRKLFQIALQLFIVPASREIAERIAAPVNDWLWTLKSLDHYSNVTGLAHWLTEQPHAGSVDDSPTTYIL